jgi:hypothetical protein
MLFRVFCNGPDFHESTISVCSGADSPSPVGELDLTSPLPDPIPLPVDPQWCLERIDADLSFCVKSQMFPAVLTCVCSRAGDPTERAVRK